MPVSGVQGPPQCHSVKLPITPWGWGAETKYQVIKKIQCTHKKSGQPQYNQNEHAKTHEEMEEKLLEIQVTSKGLGGRGGMINLHETRLYKEKKFLKNNSQKTKRPQVMFHEAVLTLEFEHGFCKKKLFLQKKKH